MKEANLEATCHTGGYKFHAVDICDLEQLSQIMALHRPEVRRLFSERTPVRHQVKFLNAQVASHPEPQPEFDISRRFTGELGGALAQVSAIFIAFGTPATEAVEADMPYVEEVSPAIAHTLDGYKVVAGEEHRPGIHPRLGARGDVAERGVAGVVRRASNPEFLREDSAVRDFLYPEKGQHHWLQRIFRGRK